MDARHHEVRPDRLIDDLDDVDFIDRVKIQQRNWIGRSRRARRSTFGTTLGDSLTVYTTRCDTLFGATYMVLSPEHPILDTVEGQAHELGRRGGLPRGRPRTSPILSARELNKDKTGVRLEGV